MNLTASQALDDATYARNPKTWIFGARKQLAVAEVLFQHLAAHRTSQTFPVEERAGCYGAAYMHAGLAVENAAKAVLIARDPSIVRDDGSLNKGKLGSSGGHGVIALVIQAVPSLLGQDETLLLKLEEHVIWAGRYTVPMKGSVLYEEKTMDALRLSFPTERARINAIVEQLIQAA